MFSFIVVLALTTSLSGATFEPSKEDDFAVFEAVLDHYSATEERHGIEAQRLIHDHSAFIVLEYDERHLPDELPGDLREAWIRRNREPHWIGDFTAPEPHLVIGGRELGKGFRLSGPDAPRPHYYNYDVLRQQFPLFQGILELTLPGYSADGTEAFVYLWTGCEGLCADGRVYHLCKLGGRWQVVSSSVVWES